MTSGVVHCRHCRSGPEHYRVSRGGFVEAERINANVNCMGFVAIGGVNVGVVAIGGVNTIGVVAIGGFNATGVIAIGGVNSRSALPLM